MNAPSQCPSCRADLPAASAFCPECGQPIRGGDDLGAPEGLSTLGGMETIGGETTRHPGREATLPALEPGQRFAERYTVAERIGAGGMGVVYRAHDSVAGQDVALKLIRPDRLKGPSDVQRLVREGVTARGVRHKNVVAVYDVGEAEGQVFLSMELLAGRSLRAWHRSLKERGQDVPYAVAARIVREILVGLEAAHEQGVVHRDLKPENVVLLADPSAAAAPLKIVDFGIARVAGGSTPATTGTGSGVGTPHYMAPEQVTQADLAGPAADLYSLSVMFYELLVDVLPQGHWQAPSGGRADVPRAIDELIQAGLSNRPASRPQSARTYLERLDAAKPSTPTEDLVDKLKERFDWKRTFGPKQKKRWIIAGVAILVLAGISSVLEDGGWDTSGGCSATDPGYGPGPSGSVSTQRVAVENLSGTWLDSVGLRYQAFVDPQGYFSAQTALPNGATVELGGQVSGRHLEFDVSSFGQQLGHGTGTWDGARTVSYTTIGIDGSVTSGVFQVLPGGM